MKYDPFDYSVFKETFPDMFKDVYCGFYLPEELFPLVWDLCVELEKVAPHITVAQVKTKFGELRFYVDGRSDVGQALIQEAQAKSRSLLK